MNKIRQKYLGQSASFYLDTFFLMWRVSTTAYDGKIFLIACIKSILFFTVVIDERGFVGSAPEEW